MNIKTIKKVVITTCACLLIFSLANNSAQAAPGQASKNVNIKKLPANKIFNNVTSFSALESNGKIYMTIGKSNKETNVYSLYFLTSKDGKDWTESVKIPTSNNPPQKLNRMRDPSIAVYGNNIMVVWSAKGSGPFGSGAIGAAISKDGGKTWKPGPAIGTKKSLVGHRFPAVAGDKKGFQIVWINAVGGVYGMKHSKGKDGKKKMKTIKHDEVAYERSFKTARLNYGATKWSNKTMIDSHSCSCCWNRIYVDSAGKLVAVFRNHNPRDISTASSKDYGKNWNTNINIGDFGWHSEVCPMNGGSFADIKNSDNNGAIQLATAWTGAKNKVGAYVMRSDNSGKSWQEPVALKADGSTGWHSDVAMLKDGKAVVIFDEMVDGGVQVFAITSKDSGKTWSKPLHLSSKKVNATYPRVLAVNGKFIALWTCKAKGSPENVEMKLINF